MDVCHADCELRSKLWANLTVSKSVRHPSSNLKLSHPASKPNDRASRFNFNISSPFRLAFARILKAIETTGYELCEPSRDRLPDAAILCHFPA